MIARPEQTPAEFLRDNGWGIDAILDGHLGLLNSTVRVRNIIGDDVIVFVIGEDHVFETMFHPGEYDWTPISAGKVVDP